MAMADLALHEKGRPVALSEISERQMISLSYLEQLFARLRQAGLVLSARGPGGGYRLARGLDEVRVSDIILAVNEPLKATRCIQPGGRRKPTPGKAERAAGCMPDGQQCLTHDLWDNLGKAIQAYLSNVSLADVIHNPRRATVVFEDQLSS